MTTLATSLSAFTDMGYSLLKLGISIGLIVLLIPALLLSLLLFAILVSPILIASLIYLNGLDNLYFFPLALELKSVIDDVLALSGDPLSVKARKTLPFTPTPKTVPVTPRRSSFISDFESSKEASLDIYSHRLYGTAPEGFRSSSRSSRKAIPDFDECDSPSSMQCHNGDNPDTPRSPRNKPFDLTDKEFSPHWSAGRPIQWSPSPSPLNISFTGPTSPARWPSPEIDSEGQSLRSPAFRPTKGDIEPSPFRLEPVKDAIDDKITPLLLLASSKAHFSTSLPDALRNINSSELGLLNSHPQEPFSPLGNDSLELLVPKIDVKAVPENRKQALISEFKKVIAELEATLEKRDEDVYTKELLSGAPTPPPRPTTFPRNRMARDCPMARWGELNPKLFLPPPFDSPQKENGRLSPVADGLYGAENVDADYWKGFDQTYDVRDRSFESIKSDEDLQPLRWKNKSKWIEKGVNVLTQLDEESLGSNSSAKVTPSKKEVRWKDEALPISPVAEIIPHDETPFHADLEIEAQDLPGLPLFPVQPSTLLFIENSVPGRQVETPISTENIKVEADSDFKHQASVEPAPQTPTRPALVAARNVNRELAANSPVNSPSGSVSGKLIKLFEELSKPGARSPPKTLDVSPANSGRLDSVAVEDMMTSTGFVMDGSVDGAAEADKKRDVLAPVQNDGTQAARHDGLDESF